VAAGSAAPGAAAAAASAAAAAGGETIWAKPGSKKAIEGGSLGGNVGRRLDQTTGGTAKPSSQAHHGRASADALDGHAG